MNELQKQNQSIILHEKAIASRTSLVIAQDTTEREWEDMGGALNQAESAVHWWIGDWANFGIKKFRKEATKKTKEIASKVGLSYNTVRDDRYVVESIKLAVRTASLDFGHHKLLAPLDEPEQIKWRDLAINGGWSIARLRKEIKNEKYGFDLKLYNIWGFSAIPEEQTKYPGQIPQGVVDNLIYYYSKKNDLIYDPFGGGGVTIDACKIMGRRHYVCDISPFREEIIKWDIVKDGIPKEAKDATLVFLDPPYWSQNKGKYGDEPTNLANLDVDEFHDALEKVVVDCLGFAEYVALLISPTQHQWNFQDHAAEMIVRLGVPYHRISVPYNTQIHGGNYVKMAKENKQWLYLNRDLLVYRGMKMSTKENE